MGTYFLVTGIIVILYFLIKELRVIDCNKKYNILVAIILIVFLSLRDETVGRDIEEYQSFYKAFDTKDLVTVIQTSRFEIGYIIFNKIVNFLFFGNFHCFLLVVAIFSIGAFAFVVNKHSTMPWLSWLLYLSFNFLIYSISGLRAGMAMSFGLFAIHYLFLPTTKKNVVGFYLFAIIALCFHKTAIVYFLLYPLCKIRSNIFIYSCLFMVAAAFSFAGKQILTWLINNFYPNYTLSEGGGYNLLVLLIGVYLAGFIMLPRECKTSIEYRIFSRITFTCFVLQILTLQFSQIARIVEFYLIIVIFYIPYILSNLKETYRFGSCTIVIIGAIILLYLNLQKNGAGIVPYVFFWE